MEEKNTTQEFAKKAKGLKGDELIALAEQEGVELTDEQLEAVSGGWTGTDCPKCGSDNTGWEIFGDWSSFCGDCGHRW